MENELFLSLVEFLREQIREFNMVINRDTLIENDLGVTGDDAEDLIQAFSKKFKVDISKFDFSKYFYSEVAVIAPPTYKIAPFSVRNLEMAAMAGKLDESTINE